MNNENEYRNNTYENLKCIWMASQVIEYKLCDNKFDCENCMFDKVMRNLLDKKETNADVTGNVLDTILEKLSRIKYDDKIIYLKNNLIAKEICLNIFYIGIDPILSCFLDNESSVTINDGGKQISTGQLIIKISGVWGAISLSSPMNFMIYEKVSGRVENPLKRQWHAIVGLERQQLSSSRLTSRAWDNRYERALRIIEEIKSEIPQVGCTMMDGGSQIKFLHQLVGSKKYETILNLLKTQ